ncbi:SMAD/FHA domain-containing protein [Phlebopus sp. FC_14]|nr:SMAD/FHA domain-containing protein [Phlebopus sp. FC_14]
MSRKPSPAWRAREEDRPSRRDRADDRDSVRERYGRGYDRRRDEYSDRGRVRDSERGRGWDEDSRDYGRDRRGTNGRGRGSNRDGRKDYYRDRDRRSDRRRDHSRERAGPSRRSTSPRRPSPQRHSTNPRSRSRSVSPLDKGKPNFKPSGLLAAATNTVKAADGISTVLKYNEPPEARKPTLGWRLYVFKGSEQTELLHIHRQSAYLIGRDRTVADIFIEHPSCSKQHAVIQYRQVQQKDEFGEAKPVIKPFIIDLESTNHTHVNDETIPTTRFYELKAGDVIKFGLSNREYVLLHDEAA